MLCITVNYEVFFFSTQTFSAFYYWSSNIKCTVILVNTHFHLCLKCEDIKTMPLQQKNHYVLHLHIVNISSTIIIIIVIPIVLLLCHYNGWPSHVFTSPNPAPLAKSLDTPALESLSPLKQKPRARGRWGVLIIFLSSYPKKSSNGNPDIKSRSCP